MYQKINTKPHVNVKPQTTAHLAQTMALLNMSNDELEGEIQKNLASNPALEVGEEKHCMICGNIISAGSRCKSCLNKQLQSEPQFLTFVSTRESSRNFFEDENDRNFEESMADMQTLPEYVLRQIGMELINDEKLVAASILTQVDEDGFVDVDVLELSSYFHVPISSVEKVKKLIQHADPVGVGSKNAQEAMLVQIDELKKIREISALTEKIIAEKYQELLRKQYHEIARELGVTEKQVEENAQFIVENLNPFPARSSWGDVRNKEQDDLVRFGEADIVLSYLENDPQNPIVIEVFQPMNSNLVLNAAFQNALKTSEKEIKEKMREDLDKASLFIKCLQQRTNTILRMMQILVTIQEKYIREGDRYLKPITRAQIAKRLSVHESTVSRAVSSKTVQMPNKKVYPLSVFFDRSLQIRTVMKQIIENESEPLSDLQIMKELEKRGISIARRTVAKYRDMEGISPAFRRKEKPT